MIRGRLCNVLLAVALVAAPAAIADTVSWSIMPNVGTYDYAGGSAVLTGTGIGVQSVQDSTTGAFFNIINGRLNFTTGFATGQPWTWGAGQPGSLNLTGCISTVTVSGQCDGSSPAAVLLSDDFTSAQILSFGPTFQLTLGNITGNIDSTLASDLGVSTVISSALYNTSVLIGGSSGSSFSNAPNLGGSINSINASSTSMSVPEYWGVAENFGFLVIVLLVLGGLTRFGRYARG
jgi:hypothetical protein